MSDFLQPNAGVRIHKVERRDVAQMVDETERGRAVRLYCTQRDPRPEGSGAWSLQIRGPLGVGFLGAKDGKDYVIADARLNRQQLRALRDAIDAELAEDGGGINTEANSYGVNCLDCGKFETECECPS